jgi:hypothetical protein
VTDLNATWNEQTRGPRMSEATGRVIFKYQMPVLEQFTMDLPQGAEIIRMEDQGGMFWMWAVVNTDAPTEKRYFRAFKTGAKIPDDVELKYVGFCAVFVQMELGLYIFEEVKPVRAYATPEGWRKVGEIAKQLNIPVVDVKLSKFDPSDYRGMPDFVENDKGEKSLNWSKLMCEAMGYDVYNTPSKESVMRGIDEVLMEFEDIFRPLFQKPINQKRIDEIEAQGGFEEDE